MAVSAIVALASTAASYVAGTMVFSTFLATFAFNFVMGAALNALTPKPKIDGSQRGYQVNSRGSALSHQIIYGKVRVGGAIVFDEATGEENKYFHRIIAVSGHEIESFDEIYINDEVVTLDGSGNVTSPERFVDKVRIKTHLGSPNQSADADLVAESDKWTSAHRLRGIAYMYVRLAFDTDVFPNGVPTVTATVKGKKVYNPATGTTVWSDNPALCLRDYLVSSYGIAELPANIDDTLVNSAVTVCNQTNTSAGTTRYTCNGAFTTDLTPYDVINNLLTSMGGSLWYAQGKWRMKPAYWTAPVLDLNEDDLRSSIGVATRHSRRDNFNVVKGTFRGEESNWQTTDYPQVDSAAFLAADNGQESVADVDLPFTANSIEARRIARIALERNRQQLTVTAAFGLKTMQVQVGDNIRLTNSRFGWANKEFEVLSWNFGLTDGLDLQVNMNLRETAESVFDEVDDGVVYERDNTNLPSAFDTQVPSLNAPVVRTTVNNDGTVIAEIDFSWVVAEPSLVSRYDFQWRTTTNTEWNASDLVGTKFTLSPALSGQSYNYRVRSTNYVGVKSDFATGATSVSAGNDGTVPNAPSVIGGFGGYNNVVLNWETPTQNTDGSELKDLSDFEIYRGLSTEPNAIVGKSSGEFFVDSGLLDNTTYYYRIKSVDFSGNKSAFSATVSFNTNPEITNGADGASVLVVFADDAAGNNQSLSAGAREYVQYYEYTDTVPTLPVSGTFVKFVGNSGQSVWPIYADDAAGAGQSFDPTGKDYVNFYESNTLPTLPVSGVTFVKWVGADGTSGIRGAGRFNIPVASLPTTSQQAELAFLNSVSDLVDRDQGWFYTGPQSSPTSQNVWIYNLSTDLWVQQDEVIDGSLIVSGTITADRFEAQSIAGLGMTIGSLSDNPTGERIVISDTKIQVYDGSNTLRVVLGDLT